MTSLVNFNFSVYFSVQDWKYSKKDPSSLEMLNSKQHLFVSTDFTVQNDGPCISHNFYWDTEVGEIKITELNHPKPTLTEQKWPILVSFLHLLTIKVLLLEVLPATTFHP